MDCVSCFRGPGAADKGLSMSGNSHSSISRSVFDPTTRFHARDFASGLVQESSIVSTEIATARLSESTEVNTTAISPFL